MVQHPRPKGTMEQGGADPTVFRDDGQSGEVPAGSMMGVK